MGEGTSGMTGKKLLTEVQKISSLSDSAASKRNGDEKINARVEIYYYILILHVCHQIRSLT